MRYRGGRGQGSTSLDASRPCRVRCTANTRLGVASPFATT
jgi:hypothetical protein